MRCPRTTWKRRQTCSPANASAGTKWSDGSAPEAWVASSSAADIRSRILHEARAAARINHPNIAVVHDVVEHDGRPFLVMEYVEGENLAQSLKRERPSVDKILAIGRQLSSALTAAHANHIIHRDLKPANVQLAP